MGFIDKLKNIFFEEEEEEEDIPETPNYSKRDNTNEVSHETIAKKVEISKKEKVFEEGRVEIKKKPDENGMEIKKVQDKPRFNTELIFDDEDFILEPKTKIKKEIPKNVEKNRTDVATKRVDSSLYKPKENHIEVKKTDVKAEYPKTSFSNLNTKSEEKSKSKTFTPSPIISPIYGILDKNYRKEEVKENKEIILSSRPRKIDLDSIRNKAFGDLENDLFENTDTDIKYEQDEKNLEKNRNEIKKKHNNKEDKPTIDKVTIAEADEYYNDLGLAYNTDYKDLSKDLSDGKEEGKKSDNLEDNLFDLIESMYDKEE